MIDSDDDVLFRSFALAAILSLAVGVGPFAVGCSSDAVDAFDLSEPDAAGQLDLDAELADVAEVDDVPDAAREDARIDTSGRDAGYDAGQPPDGVGLLAPHLTLHERDDGTATGALVSRIFRARWAGSSTTCAQVQTVSQSNEPVELAIDPETGSAPACHPPANFFSDSTCSTPTIVTGVDERVVSHEGQLLRSNGQPLPSSSVWRLAGSTCRQILVSRAFETDVVDTTALTSLASSAPLAVVPIYPDLVAGDDETPHLALTDATGNRIDAVVSEIRDRPSMDVDPSCARVEALGDTLSGYFYSLVTGRVADCYPEAPTYLDSECTTPLAPIGSDAVVASDGTVWVNSGELVDADIYKIEDDTCVQANRGRMMLAERLDPTVANLLVARAPLTITVRAGRVIP